MKGKKINKKIKNQMTLKQNRNNKKIKRIKKINLN